MTHSVCRVLNVVVVLNYSSNRSVLAPSSCAVRSSYCVDRGRRLQLRFLLFVLLCPVLLPLLLVYVYVYVTLWTVAPWTVDC